MLKTILGLFNSPKEINVQVVGQGIEFKIPKGKTLLEGALKAGLSFPHECKVGTCGRCKYHLLEGKVFELTPSYRVLEPAEYQAGYRLACQAIPKTDLRIEVAVPLAQTTAVKETLAVVVKQKGLSPDVVELTLQPESPIDFKPGQYADLEIMGSGIRRSYSFANPPSADGSLQFHIRLVPSGKFSAWLLSGDKTGEKVLLRAPYGQFYYRDSTGPMICVAGGTGFAPIKSILESMDEKQRQRDVALFYGARQQRDLYCLDMIEALRKNWKGRFEFVPVLSDEPADSEWQGKRGFPTDYLEEYVEAGAASEAYLCGPPPMVDAAEEKLIRLGVSKDKIYADRFTPTSSSST